MKTDDLINALAVDTATTRPPVSRTMSIAFAVGAVVSTLVLVALIGIRENLFEAISQSWEVAFKLIVTLAVVLPAYGLFKRSARPEGDLSGIAPFLIIAPLLLLGGVAYALQGVAWSDLASIVMSGNWTRCVVLIPLSAIAPLIATLYGLRDGAPAHPAMAGAAAGLLSGALAAFLYATHCDADNPMFVAVWYTFGIALMTIIGAAVGSRLLRW